MGAALQYLSLVPGDAAPDTAILRDRIHRSGAPDVYAAPEPMFPFIAEDVPVDPSAAAQHQYQQQQQVAPAATAYSQPAPSGKCTPRSSPVCFRGGNAGHLDSNYCLSLRQDCVSTARALVWRPAAPLQPAGVEGLCLGQIKDSVAA